MNKERKKILIVNIFGIGDVLFTTPLIRNIKEAYPDSFIGYVSNRRSWEALEKNPYIDKIYIYVRDEYKLAFEKSKVGYLKKMRDFYRSIKDGDYDMVFDFSLNSGAGFMTWLAGIPYRGGFDYKNRGFWLNQAKKLIGFDDKPVVKYYLDLLESIDIPVLHEKLELHIDKDDKRWADEYIKSLDVNMSKPLVGIVPAGGDSWGKDAKYKRWGVHNYAKLADKIVENWGAAIILLGGENELALSEEVSSLMNHSARIACGKTSIRQFAGLIQKCSLMVVNDGGPLHISVAMNTPSVSIFGPVDDAVYGPYPRENHRVARQNLPCQPCYRRFKRSHCEHIRCLTELTVDNVYQEVENLLSQQRIGISHGN